MRNRNAVLMTFVAAAAVAAPQAELWDEWLPHDPTSTAVVDHAVWDGLLERYLVTDDPSGVSLFAYSSVSAADRAALRQYLSVLQAVTVDSLNRDEQMAYWINLYNSLTIALVLDHWPVESIRDINPGGGSLFSRGPWDAEIAVVQGRALTLNDIEHRILRPIWQDPRIHYAVNCASIGCPDLQPVAFTGAAVERMLERAAVRYVNHPRGVAVDGRVLYLSSIYDWFSEDFGDSRESLLQHLYRYAAPSLRRELEPFVEGRGRLRYRYDWAVNGIEGISALRNGATVARRRRTAGLSVPDGRGDRTWR